MTLHHMPGASNRVTTDHGGPHASGRTVRHVLSVAPCPQATDARKIFSTVSASTVSNSSWLCPSDNPSSRAREKLAMSPGLRASRALGFSRSYPPDSATTRMTRGCPISGA
ncbi:MAG: hypothetical protein Q4C85_03565 [Actinomyces sp.]|uniref:hypothetical protein n=1 Tax=Actinomyces sp. TaxID=29317 RepID=UPI0026DDB821|nr:hypothetical protein [Actinomyces sp.]MDO4242827.1 hypothetical protein [Actinomyces sp.]